MAISFLMASLFLNLFFIFCLFSLYFIMKEKIDGLKAYNNFTQRVCNLLNENKKTSEIKQKIKKSIGRHHKKIKMKKE